MMCRHRRLYAVVVLALVGCAGPIEDGSLSAIASRAVAADCWRSMGNVARLRPPLDGVTFGTREITTAIVTFLVR